MSDLAPPPPPATEPPPLYPSPPAYQPPPIYEPAGTPGYMPPPIAPTAAAGMVGMGLLYQFGGYAAWSIGLGVVAIVVPFATNYYFPILPIAGGINGIRAMQRGRVIGGLVGIAVNAVAGLLTLAIWRLSS